MDKGLRLLFLVFALLAIILSGCSLGFSSSPVTHAGETPQLSTIQVYVSSGFAAGWPIVPPPPRRDAVAGVPRAARRLAGRGRTPDEHSVSAAQRHHQGAPGGQRGYCPAPGGANPLGRPDLADTSGQVGSLAGTARSGAATAGQGSAKVRGDRQLKQSSPGGYPRHGPPGSRGRHLATAR